ncbi:tubulin domain-containing protein [Chytridium lagenaria]|nr:tubulin domain-containing protein [Chytridium lagenaria]
MAQGRRREILTLQLGHLSSFVGTHLWNIQDAYDASAPIDQNVMFCESTNAKGEDIYYPRVVVLDLKGNFGSLKVDGDSQEPTANEIGNYCKKSPRSFASTLAKSVNVWSDFNSIFYHPKSLVKVHTQFEIIEQASKFPLSIFNQGRDIWRSNAEFTKKQQREDFMEENLRFFVEEADSLQGFQIMADTSNGFSGLAAEVIDALRDEYGKLDSFVFGVGDEPSSEYDKYNDALSLASFSSSATSYIPLYKPNAFDRNLFCSKYGLADMTTRYAWTGFLASAIETITLPSRAYTASRVNLSDILHPFPNSRLTTVATLGISPSIRSKSIFGQAIGDQHKRMDWIFDLTLNKAFDLDEEAPGKTHVLRGELEGADGRSIHLDLPMPQPEAFPDIFSTGLERDKPTLFAQLKASPRIAEMAGRAARTVTSIPPSHAIRLLGGATGGGSGSVTAEETSELKEVLHELESVYGELTS